MCNFDKDIVFGHINQGEIIFVQYKPEHFDGIVTVLEKSFFPNECTTIGTEIDQEDATGGRTDLIDLCRDVTKDGVSLVAVATNCDGGRQVVGFVLNKIQSIGEIYYEDFIKTRCVSENAKSLIQFMIDVDAKFDLFGHYDTDCFLEIMFLSVLPEFERRSIGRKLCEYSLNLAGKLLLGQCEPPDYPTHLKQKRPRVVTANLSSRHSQRIGELLGFETHFVFPYTDIMFNGKTYAERINNPMHPTTTLVAKRL